MQNYKVFINNGLIFFGQKQELPNMEPTYADFQTISLLDIPQIIDGIKTNRIAANYWVNHTDSEEAYQKFASYFEVWTAAGGIVKNNKSEILMIHRFGKWDFPKGHLEENESISEGAVREVLEETGIDSAEVVSQLPCTYHIYSFHHDWIIKKTYWYLMHSNYQGKLVPQMEEDILAAIWVPNYALHEYLCKSYPALQFLIHEAEEDDLLA